MTTQLNNKSAKPIDIVEITTAVPKEQLNTLKKLIYRYILDNNNQSVAYKLLDLTHTKLRDDVSFFVSPKDDYLQ